jgi:hypothetical protein
MFHPQAISGRSRGLVIDSFVLDSDPRSSELRLFLRTFVAAHASWQWQKEL